jgi:hypothetical protein
VWKRKKVKEIDKKGRKQKAETGKSKMEKRNSKDLDAQDLDRINQAVDRLSAKPKKCWNTRH